jgi:hypothetical protein
MKLPLDRKGPWALWAPALLLAVAMLPGCQRLKPPADPALVEPAEFSTWPSVTPRPIPVGLHLWRYCAAMPPAQEAEARRHGPHMGYSIVVRVSPEAAAAFREGKPLPAGAVVVKEKYADEAASGPLRAYALMIKRQAGYDPEGGDWEYAFVNLAPERKMSRGRLAKCAGCHASARDRDYLFRSYGDASR